MNCLKLENQKSSVLKKIEKAKQREEKRATFEKLNLSKNKASIIVNEAKTNSNDECFSVDLDDIFNN